MAYQSFLIADFKAAKVIGKEPWLIPKDGFSTLENMHINKGVLEKRLGYSQYAQMKHGAVAQTATSITGIQEYVKDGMPNLLVMDSKDTSGVFSGRCNLYNPIDQTMTDISSDLSTPADIFSGSASDFFSFVNWLGVGYMANNVDQIHQWAGRGNAVVPFDIIFDTDEAGTNQVDTCRFLFVKDDRLLLLETTEFGEWQPQRLRYSATGTKVFSSTAAGFIDAVTQHRIVTAGFIGNDIAVYMEGGSTGSLWLIKSTGTSDIPFRWQKITETELCTSPYSGVEFRDGLVSIGLSNVLFFNGFPIRVKFLDLPNIRDFLAEFNNDLIRSVFGYRQKEQTESHLLYTFADSSSTSMDRILDFSETDNNWTKHKSKQSFFVNIIGGFNDQQVPVASELAGVLGVTLVEDMHTNARDVHGTPAPITLIGGRNSRLYKWNDGGFDGTDDANGNIEIKAISGDLNPFLEEGRKVDCEKIGFLVDNDANASFLASIFKNTKVAATVIGSDLNQYRCILAHTSATASRPVTGANHTTFWEATGETGVAETWLTATEYSGPYKNKLISCDADDDSVDMFWVWIYCDGEIGYFHRLQISHTERSNRPRIHAFDLYFQPAGRISLAN